MQSEGNVTLSDSNATYTFNAGDDFITVDLSNANVGVDTNILVSIVGATDFSGNLVSPNPVSATVKKVKSDLVNPAVEGVTVKDLDEFTVDFTEELSANPTILLDGVAVVGTVAQDSTDKSKYNVTLTAPVSGVHTIGVSAGYTDISGNAGAAYSKLVDIKADTTDPAYVSHEVKTIGGVQYLVVNYNEEVIPNTSATVTGSYVDANHVTHSATLGAVSGYDADNDGIVKAVKVALGANLSGSYSVTVPATIVTDNGGNNTAAKSISFNLGTLNDTTKPAITDTDSDPLTGYSGVTVQSSTDKVTVHFTKAVTAATALNVANYKVEGQNVFSKAIFNGDQQTVELTLNEGAIGLTGTRNLWIGNVADASGNVMNAVTTSVLFQENVKPTISSATLTGATTISVKFSENMLDTSLTDSDDFEVYVDGALVAGTVTGTGDTYTITLGSAVSDLAKPISLKVLTTNDVVDATTPANALKTTGTIGVSK
jgi:trimeric autotransporter adhesin